MRFIALLLLSLVALGARAGEVHIAVAANFRHTAEALNRLFLRETGHIPTLSSGSTGGLHTQITHGAPFDLFLSADSQSPARLEAEGHGPTGQRFCYAMGQLVLVGGSGSLADLGNPQLSLAIANPATAPYGRAAGEVLDRSDFAAAGQRKLVRANNVVQAYQYWYSGAVDLALVARSLVAPGQGLPIPQDWHTSLEQAAILLNRGSDNPAARRYLDFLKGDAASSLIADSGYGACR